MEAHNIISETVRLKCRKRKRRKTDFKGYVDFFLLQDLVTANYSSVKFHLKHRDFDEPPLPQNEAEYLEYMENTIKFVRARGKRIAASVSA